MQQPSRLDEDVEIPADTVVVAAYGLLIPESLLARALWLNVHPSLLPRWRGAAPVERDADGRRRPHRRHDPSHDEASSTLARSRRRKRSTSAPDDDAGAVFDRSAEIAARLLDGVIADPQFEPQPEDGVTYAEKITPEDRELDLSRPAPELVNRDPRAVARTSARVPSSTAGR